MPITSRTFVRATALLLLVGLLALLGIVGTNIWLVERSQVYFDEVVQARIARRVAVDLRNQLQDLESSQRGYIITHDQKYLDPYNATLPQIDDPEQAVRIVEAAHKVCPYSNATRGNIDMKLTANGRPV